RRGHADVFRGSDRSRQARGQRREDRGRASLPDFQGRHRASVTVEVRSALPSGARSLLVLVPMAFAVMGPPPAFGQTSEGSTAPAPQMSVLPSSPPSAPDVVVSISGAPVRGDGSAKLTVIEFIDYQCPIGAWHFREALPGIERDF